MYISSERGDPPCCFHCTVAHHLGSNDKAWLKELSFHDCVLQFERLIDGIGVLDRYTMFLSCGVLPCSCHGIYSLYGGRWTGRFKDPYTDPTRQLKKLSFHELGEWGNCYCTGVPSSPWLSPKNRLITQYFTLVLSSCISLGVPEWAYNSMFFTHMLKQSEGIRSSTRFEMFTL